MRKSKGPSIVIKVFSVIYALYALNTIFYEIVYFGEDCYPCSQTELLTNIYFLAVIIVFFLGAIGLFMLKKWGFLLTQVNLFYGIFDLWIFDSEYYLMNYSLTVMVLSSIIVLLIVVWLNMKSLIQVFKVKTRKRMLLGSILGSIIIQIPLVLL